MDALPALDSVHDSLARRRYHDEAVAAAWSTRELDRQTTTRFVERGLAPGSSKGEMTAAQMDPALALRDLYVLEFIGLPDRLIDREAGRACHQPCRAHRHQASRRAPRTCEWRLVPQDSQADGVENPSLAEFLYLTRGDPLPAHF